jgi:hypothetical protein
MTTSESAARRIGAEIVSYGEGRFFDCASRRLAQGQKRPSEKRGGGYKGKGVGRSAHEDDD